MTVSYSDRVSFYYRASSTKKAKKRGSEHTKISADPPSRRCFYFESSPSLTRRSLRLKQPSNCAILRATIKITRREFRPGNLRQGAYLVMRPVEHGRPIRAVFPAGSLRLLGILLPMTGASRGDFDYQCAEP